MDVPAVPQTEGYRLPTDGMAPGLAIMFDDRLYQRCRDMAVDMSKADGFTPPHLIGKPYACFAVLTRAITWKLDPLAVAQSTYQTPGGRIGYEGKLVQAILENSGKFEGPIKFEHIGDWSKIRGRWKKGKSSKGYDIPQQDWADADEVGLGVVVRGKVKGEHEPREFTMWLRECFPRNSTLWPLRPEQQICYTAVRAFANIAAAGLLMGVPFDTDQEQGAMIDITPARPDRRAFTEPAAPDKPETEMKDEDSAAGDDDHAPLDHQQVYELGRAHRDQNRPMSAPVDLPQEFHEAFLDGWRARDDEITAEKKVAKK